MPSIPWLLATLRHIARVHLWHLRIDKLHSEHVITVSHDAHAVGMCTTFCWATMPLASGNNMEAVPPQVEQNSLLYHTATTASVAFLAYHTSEGYFALPVWAIPTCETFKARNRPAMWKHMDEWCSIAAFLDWHGVLLSADAHGDALWSCEMQAALYAERATTHSWMLDPHIPSQTGVFGRCANFEPPLPLVMKPTSEMLGGEGEHPCCAGGGIF